MNEIRLTVPLRASWLPEPIRTRTNRAVKALREGIIVRTKAESVSLSAGVNDLLWAHGKLKPPARITVVVSVEKGVASARLPDEKPAKAAKVSEKAAKKAAEKAESKAAESAPVGAEAHAGHEHAKAAAKA